LIVLYPKPGDPASIEAHLADLRSLPGLRGLTCYHVLDEGPDPNSNVPHLTVAVGAMAQAWFDNVADVQIAMTGRNQADAALYTFGEYRLM
jgi:hypothetical protein